MSIVNISEGIFGDKTPYRLGYDTDEDRYVITAQVVGKYAVRGLERETAREYPECPPPFVEILKEYISAPKGFQLQYRRYIRVIDDSLAYEFYEIRLAKP